MGLVTNSLKYMIYNRDKVGYTARRVYSLLGFILVTAIGVVTYLSIPQNVDIKMSAGGLPNGTYKAAIRVVDPSNVATTLYTGELPVGVQSGILKGRFSPPSSLLGKSYVVEVCTTKDGHYSQDCFTESAATKKDVVYSCPYYVSGNRPSKIAYLTGQNTVELDSRVLCDNIGGSMGTSGGSLEEYAPISRLAVAAKLQSVGTSSGIGGSVTVTGRDGVATLTQDEIVGRVIAALGDAKQATIVQQYYSTTSVTSSAVDSDSQTLILSGNQLSISGGNTVDFSVASVTSTGMLSSADFNSFSQKENALTFDATSFTRSGDTISLMSCAAGQILKNNGTAWVCAIDAGSTGSANTAGTGITIDGAGVIANTGVLSVTASGALTSSGGQNPAITLATSGDLTQLGSQLGLTDTGVTAGTYNNVTVDAKGRVTGATNVSYLTSEADGIIGNEVAGVATNGGLVMTGSGTTGSPYKVGLITTCADGQLLKYTTAGGWACASDTDTNTDAQTLTWTPGTNTLAVSGGNSVDLSSLAADTQDLSLTTTAGSGGVVNSYQIDLVNGGSVTLQDTDTNTTYSNGNGLSLTGTVFAINAPTCTGTTAKLLYTGTAFTCGTDVDTDTNTTYSAGSGLSLAGTTFALAQQGATTGQVLKWNGTAWAPAADTDTTYTASTGITITSGAIAATLGTDITSSEIVDGTIAAADLATTGATAGTYGNSGVNVAQVTVNAQGQVTAISNRALPTANTTTTGVLSSTDWNTFNGKENVLTFSDGLTRSVNNVTLMDCAASQILQRNAGDTAWVCANQVTDTNTTYTAGTGLSLTGTTFANTGVLSVTASGALTSSGGQNPAITLATSGDLTQLGSQLGLTDTGVTAGTYNNVTVDAKGRVTGATNVSYLTSEADGIIGNEVAGVATNGGLVMTGSGTTGSPYKVGLITTCADGQLLKYTTAGGWACASDTDTNTDAQTLTWTPGTNTLAVSGGNSVDLSSLAADTQDLSLTTTAGSGGVVNSYQIDLVNGGSVTLQDTDTNTTYSNGNGLSLTGTVFAINAPTCTGTTAKLLYTGTAFTCGTDVDTDTNTTYSAGSGLSLAGTTFALAQQGATTGQVLKWNGTAWAPAADTDTTYTASTGITITSGAIAATLGTDITSSEIVDGTIAAADLATTGATAGTYGNSGVNVAQVTVNAQGQVTAISNRALPTANTTTTGVLSSTDWNTFNGKENVLTFSGNGLFSRSGNTITASTCTTTGEIMKWNGMAWACAADTAGGVSDGDKGDITVSGSGLSWNIDPDSVALGTDTTGNYVAGATSGNGITVSGTAGEGWSPTVSINAPTCTGGQYLTWSGSAFSCGTPTDTNTTNFNISANGAGSQNVAAGNTVNFQNGTGTTASVDVSKNVSYSLTNTGVTAGTYGSTTTVPQITVDAQGRITGVTTQTIAFPAEVDGVIGNEVTNATANGGLTRSGSGTSGSQYTLGLLTTCLDQQLLKWTAGTTSWGCAADAGVTSAVTSLNSLNGALTLNTGTAGTDFNVSNAGSTITYNLPNASVAARGAVTTGTQTFGGAKTFNVGTTAIGFQATDGTLPHFTIDTTNKQVNIGSGTSDANAIELVLDSYNVAADPTGVDGSMYYNSNLGKFRCYEAGAWKDCIAPLSSRVFLASNQSTTSTVQADIPGMTIPVSANRTYIFSCRMTHTTAATTTAGLFSVNGPASTKISYIVKTGYSTTAEFQAAQTAFNASTNPGTGPGPTARQVYIDGTFTTTASGNFAVRYASEVNASAVTLLANSFCTLE
jgi:hypothetical protein